MTNIKASFRAALKSAPLALAAIVSAACLPAHSQNSEWVGRTVGENATRAMMGSGATSYAGTAASVLVGEIGAGIARDVDKAKAKQSQDDAIREQARRDAIYQAELMKQAKEMGIPYEQLASRSSSSMGWAQNSGQFSAFDNIQAQMNAIPRIRPNRPR